MMLNIYARSKLRKRDIKQTKKNKNKLQTNKPKNTPFVRQEGCVGKFS